MIAGLAVFVAIMPERTLFATRYTHMNVTSERSPFHGSWSCILLYIHTSRTQADFRSVTDRHFSQLRGGILRPTIQPIPHRWHSAMNKVVSPSWVQGGTKLGQLKHLRTEPSA